MLNWFRTLLNRLTALFPGIAGKIRAAYDFIFHAQTAFTELFSECQRLITDVEQELDAWKHFDINPHWRNRVIQVPHMIDTVQRFPELFTTMPRKI